MPYVELHCHSCFSFREGASTPLELVLAARQLGYPALALTDHDGLAGAMEFAQAAKEWDLRSIIGAEITLRPGSGQVQQDGVYAPEKHEFAERITRRRSQETTHLAERAESGSPRTESPRLPDEQTTSLAPTSRGGSRLGNLNLEGYPPGPPAGGPAPCTPGAVVFPTASSVGDAPQSATSHLTLLAETPRGYANLSRLISQAHLSSQRGEPALDPQALDGHTEGLIALSGCREGEVPRLVAAGDCDGARRAAQRYLELFDRDNFFVELQDNLVHGDRSRNRALVALARELRLGVVATNNAHYHERARHRLQDVLVAVRHRSTLDASERLRRKNAEFYLKSPEEMAALFADLPEAIQNTLVIAERCTPHRHCSETARRDSGLPHGLRHEAEQQIPHPDSSNTSYHSQPIAPLPPAGEGTAVSEVSTTPSPHHPEQSGKSGLSDANSAPSGQAPSASSGQALSAGSEQGFDLTRDLTYQFPDFTAPDGKSADEFLEEVCLASARDLYGWSAPKAGERLHHELDLIRQAGQAGFFLRNWELMRYAHDHDLPARGRGSSVGSLVCYLLGLSGIDPIKYDLFVGRFLNEARREEDVPDIDLDFARDARERMFEHVFATYGTERAALVANVITYRYPMAIRDVGKALGLPEADIDKLAKRMRGRFSRSLVEEMQALPEFRMRMQTPVWREFIRLVEELRGMPRHLSQHSGGVIISSTPIVEQVPVQPSAMEGRYICQWDKDSVADAGFIKMDFLGYPSLGHLYRALHLIEERHGRRIDPVRVPLDDPRVYEMIQRGDILGIVQIQSRAQLQAILRLKISSIEDLVIQVALIRPGPIQGGAVNPYILRCQGAEPVTYDHECLEPVLRETKGVIIFQEQVLEVAMAVAGFSAGQAENLRRAMSRKRSREEMEKLHETFLEGCRRNGKVDGETAERIYEKILAFAEFGFPKSHAAAMAETAGKLAWVKRYYPLEFYCAWLNEWPFGFYSPGVITNEARRNGIEVLGVDANRSRTECVIESLPDAGRGEAIRLGFNYVKGIGEAALKRLDEEAQRIARNPERLDDETQHLPHPDSSNTLHRHQPITPLPRAGEGTGVRDRTGPYASLWDFWRRTRLPREPIEHLIRLGAFAFTGLHERELLWQLGLFYQPLAAQVPLALPYEAEMVPLSEMSGDERVREDLVLTEGAIATRGHIMDLAAAGVLHEGITPSHVVDQMEEGTKLTVAGFVAVRQAPETAKGFVFHTLEDRYGLINVITKPNLVRRYKQLIIEAGALIVHGHIERQERAVNVVTERMERLRLDGARMPRERTHSFR